MNKILMPKATAVWLIDNTVLTFKQIAGFCNLHVIEVEQLASDVKNTVAPQNPVVNGQLTKEEIKRCEKSEEEELQNQSIMAGIVAKKEKKYVPKAKRQNKPSAILWIIQNYPKTEDRDIIRLLGTTRSMVNQIRNKTYQGILEIEPHSPVFFELCTRKELEKTIKQ